jgi:4-hydroxybenzoate polyprenyltransferase
VDEDIDEVSNNDRPLVTGFLTKGDMKQTSFLFFVATVISGFLAGYTAFFFIMTFTALYYVYSAPPTRFKLIPFFSSFIIGLCSLTLFMAGFYLIFPVKYVSAFPTRMIWAVVLIFFLHSHIRDVKDVLGDKKAGIKTVPVLFGDKWGVKVTGFISSLAFILVPFFLGSYIIFATAIPSALANYYFINKKPYVEKYVFYTYFVFVLATLLLLIF